MLTMTLDCLLNVDFLAAAAFGPPRCVDLGPWGSAGPTGDKAQHQEKGEPDKEDKQGNDKGHQGKLSYSSAPPSTSRQCAVTVFGNSCGEGSSFFDEDVDEDLMESWEEGVRTHRLLQVLLAPGMSDGLPGAATTSLRPLTKDDYAKSFRPM